MNTIMNNLETTKQIELSHDMIVDSLTLTGNAAIDNVLNLFNETVEENKLLASPFLTAFVKHNMIYITEIFTSDAHTRHKGLHPVEWMYLATAFLLFCQVNELGIEEDTLKEILIQANRRHYYKKEIVSAFGDVIPEDIFDSVSLTGDASQWM